MTTLVTRVDRERKAKTAQREREEEVDFGGIKDYSEEPDLHYRKGTTLVQAFTFRQGETEEELIRAFRRITKGGPYMGDYDGRGDSFPINLDTNGKLISIYRMSDGGEIVHEEIIDMLSGRIKGKYKFYDEFRRKTVRRLFSHLRDDLDANKQAIDMGRSEYGQTTFTVEMGLLEALTGTWRKEATKAEIEEDQRLAREAKKTAAQLTDKDREESSTHPVSISDQPVDKETVDLNFRILSAIRDHYDFDPVQQFQMDMTGYVHKDNIGQWFKSCSSLLTRYQSVVVDIGQLFTRLGIPSTNDEQAIRNAYRLIANRTHPDKTLDLPAEERVAAQLRFQDATAAYENVISRIGKININRLVPTYYLGRISRLFHSEAFSE